MDVIKITRSGGRWFADVNDSGAVPADTLTQMNAHVSALLRTEPGQNVSAQFLWPENIVGPAFAIAKERMQLKQREADLDAKTRAEIVRLGAAGISGRDIATLLGVSPGRVSQQRGVGLLFGSEDDPEAELHIIDLLTASGVVTGHGRGPREEKIDYLGVVYVATGGSHEVNGSSLRHTYVPAE